MSTARGLRRTLNEPSGDGIEEVSHVGPTKGSRCAQRPGAQRDQQQNSGAVA